MVYIVHLFGDSRYGRDCMLHQATVQQAHRKRCETPASPRPTAVSRIMFSTDGADLKRGYLDSAAADGNSTVPTIILGPGQPEMAHQTDEWCSMSKLDASVEMFSKIMRDWNHLQRMWAALTKLTLPS